VEYLKTNLHHAALHCHAALHWQVLNMI